MAKEYKKEGMDVVVTLQDDDALNYKVIFKDYSGPAAGTGTLIEGIIDIKFEEISNSSEPKNPAKPVKFNKKVEIKIQYTDEVVAKLPKGKTPDDLKLKYYLGDESLSFLEEDGKTKVKTTIDKKNKTGTVKFKNWILDPPVGWDFG